MQSQLSRGRQIFYKNEDSPEILCCHTAIGSSPPTGLRRALLLFPSRPSAACAVHFGAFSFIPPAMDAILPFTSVPLEKTIFMSETNPGIDVRWNGFYKPAAIAALLIVLVG